MYTVHNHELQHCTKIVSLKVHLHCLPALALTDLDGLGPRVPLLPQHPPARQLVAEVRELIVVLRAHVDREDVLGAHALHDVSRQVVDVAAVE